MRSLFVPFPEEAPPPTPPNDYQQIRTTPDMFGGAIGRAQEQAGGQLRQLGNELSTRYDELASTQAYTDYQNTVNDLMYGNPEKGVRGYLQMTGEEAMKALPSIRQQMEGAVGRIKGGLMSAGSQVDFERASRRLQSVMLQQAGRHYDEAQKVWGLSTLEAQQASIRRAIALNPYDDAYVENQTQDMRSAAVQSGTYTNKNPLLAIGEADSHAVQARLEGLFARGDYATASRVFEANKGKLDPNLQQSYGMAIRSHATKGEGDALANWALGLGPKPEAGAYPAQRGGMSVGGAVPGRISEVGVGEGHVAPKSERIAFARGYAASRGVNPDAVIATMAGEGLNRYVGDGGTSFGDLQLHVGGGMGDQALAAGINIRDPNTWKEQLKFGIDRMAENKGKGAGWYAGQWHGAPRWAAERFALPAAGGGDQPPDSAQAAPTDAERFAANAAQATGAGAAGIVPVGAQGAQAQQIPTSPAAPPQPTAPQSPNRTGLPPLSEQWDKIWNSNFSDEAKAYAWEKAKTRYQAFEADAARQERVTAERQKQAMEARIGQIQKDTYSPHPTISAQDIVNDPSFDADPKMREHMINFINNPPGSGVPAPQSYAAALSLVDRIRLPEGNPQKITSVDQIYDQMHHLNRTDFDFVVKQFNDIRSPGGETLTKQKADFFKKYSPFINKSNPLANQVDPVGQAREYEFEQYVDHQIEAYRAAGKNPLDLFRPTSPDFVGRQEVLNYYQPTMQESNESMTNWATTTISPLAPLPEYSPGATRPMPAEPAPTAPPLQPPEFAGPRGSTSSPGGISVPIPPIPPHLGRPARKSGETPEQYRYRLWREMGGPTQ